MKKYSKSSSLTVSLLASLTLSACSTYTAKKEVADYAQATETKIATVTARAVSNVFAPRESRQDVKAPWIAGKSVPLAKEVSVPEPLRRNVRTTMLSQNCVTANTLNVLASCITEATGLPVRVKPEARLSYTLFAPRMGGSSATQPVVARPSTTNPSGQNSINGQPTNGVFGPQAADVPLSKLLDDIAASYSVSYRLASDGVLEFYRLDTQTFRIKALAQKFSSKVSQTTGFNNNSSTSFDIKDSDAMESIRKAALSLGTMAGTVTVSPETQALIVTDTPEALASITKYLSEENKRLTRRVTLVVDQFYVSSKDNQEFSIDWSLVYGALSTGTDYGSRQGISPGSLSTQNAGSFSMTQQTGRFAGTKVLVKSLSEQGLVVQHRSFPLSTQNGVPVSIGLPTIFDYVSEITFTAIGTGATNNVAPTVKQKEERVGTYLTITPDAQDDGQVIVNANFQDRTGTLNPYVVSAGGFNSTLQQRSIDEISNMVRTVMRVGVPTVIGGMSEIVNKSGTRRLNDGAPVIIGGSDAVNRTKRSMILVVTAIAEDGV